MTYAEALRKMREECRVTQEMLAHILSVSFATVNKWENNKTKPLRTIRGQIVDYAKSKNVSEEVIAALENIM